MSTALAGLRVVEVSQGMAGAMAGMILADNGAEVGKVEPPWGDRTRSGPGFPVYHRGKQSVVLDLSRPADNEDLAALLAGADALVTDVRDATAVALGVDWPAARAANPGLVHVSISGFGPAGPLAGLPGYEWIVAAKSGLMGGRGDGRREGPTFTPTPIASFGAAQLAVQGLLAALRARDVTGEGQRVQTSLLHALVAYFMDSGPGRRFHDPAKAQLSGVVSLGFMTARCADGRYLQMCSRLPHLFRNWLRVIGLPEIADDPAMVQAPDVFPSAERLHEVEALVRRRMLERNLDEWLELFLAGDVGADPFLAADEFLRSPQALATGRVVVVEDAEVGRSTQIGPLAQMSATPSVIDRGAPRLGEHTAAALAAARSRRPAASARSAARLRYPLEGITAVEAAFFYAAPFSLTLLAQLGARVIKVEPPVGDPTRRNWLGDYAKTTAGKESVIADLKSARGREIVHRLVAGADLFLHNFRPGVPEKLGIDFDTLSLLNPRLVYVYASCYGTGGPWSDRPGFHSTPSALAGSGILEAGVGNPPVDRAFGDPAGALGSATAAMLGLAARDRSGRGQYVETTMLASLGYAMAPWSIGYDGKPPSPAVDADQRGFSALCRLYPTGAGWLLLCCATEEEVRRLGQAVGLGNRGELDSPAWRAGHDAELTEQLTAAFSRRPAGEWEDLLLAAGVPAVRADGIDHKDFMLTSDQVTANGMAVADEMAGLGSFMRGASCFTFPDSGVNVGGCEPLGASTARILAALGYREEEVARLVADGVSRAVGQGLPV